MQREPSVFQHDKREESLQSENVAVRDQPLEQSGVEPLTEVDGCWVLLEQLGEALVVALLNETPQKPRGYEVSWRILKARTDKVVISLAENCAVLKAD